jgi:hypothetical protein
MDLEELFLMARGMVYIGIIVKVLNWCIGQAIHSWRTKDENFRRDCVVIPICAVILGVGVAILGLDALFHFIPYGYLNSLSGYKG